MQQLWEKERFVAFSTKEIEGDTGSQRRSTPSETVRAVSITYVIDSYFVKTRNTLNYLDQC